MNRPLRIRIDRLILHGFDPRDRHAIGDAVRGELARLLADGEVAEPPAPLTHPRDVEGIGGAIAHATHGAVKKETGRGR